MVTPSKRINVYIAGLGCQGCIIRVENAVYRMPGVIYVGVSLSSMKMMVTSSDDFDEAMMASKLEQLGFRVTEGAPAGLSECRCGRRDR